MGARVQLINHFSVFQVRLSITRIKGVLGLKVLTCMPLTESFLSRKGLSLYSKKVFP